MNIKIIIFDWYGVMDSYESKYMFELVFRLRKRYKVGVLSNMSLAGRNYICSLKNLCINFDFFYTSSELGFHKPEKEIYIKVLNMLDVGPSEVVFIDDSYENVEAAKNAGLIGIYFESYEKLFRDLQRLKIRL